MASRFRPFGVLGSSVEVLVGLWIISGVITDEENYSAGFAAIVVVLGALPIGVGLIGLITAARSRRRASET